MKPPETCAHGAAGMTDVTHIEPLNLESLTEIIRNVGDSPRWHLADP